jgi:hypothetical protein
MTSQADKRVFLAKRKEFPLHAERYLMDRATRR